MVRRRPASPGPTRLRSVRTAGFTLTEGHPCGRQPPDLALPRGADALLRAPGRVHGDVGWRAPHLFARDPQGDARGRAALRRLRSGRRPRAAGGGGSRACLGHPDPRAGAGREGLLPRRPPGRPGQAGVPGVPSGRRCRAPRGRGADPGVAGRGVPEPGREPARTGWLRGSARRGTGFTPMSPRGPPWPSWPAGVGVHPVTLARAFRRTFGCTIGEYLRRLRIERAAEQLATGTQPLAEIALAAGFADQSHFSNVFRRRVGMSPSAYRREVRGRV